VLPAVPPQDLDCPDPRRCPVATGLPELNPVSLGAGTPLYRVYDGTWGYDEHNPGYGDARFSPIDDPLHGGRLPSMYLAATPTAALLETVFHDVHHDSARIVYERDLLGKLLAHVGVPAIGALGDLRDPELRRLGLGRGEVVASPAEHYPCTRRLAVEGLARTFTQGVLQGFIWHSRQAELAGEGPTEVIVLFGDPRYPSGRGTWPLTPPGLTALYEGPGRLLVDQIAEQLRAVIETVQR
jgi:hypothetical protein